MEYSSVENDDTKEENNNGNVNHSKLSLVGKSGGAVIHSENYMVNQKQELLKQFDPHIKEQLSNHTWSVISYNPLKFYIADSKQKQIIISTVKKEKINQHDDNFNLSLSNEIHSLCPKKIIIEAIPIEVIKHEDPLGLSNTHRYTIKFETPIEKQKIILIGPKSLDEILEDLHDRTLIVDQQTRASEALSSIILSMEKDNKVILKNDLTTPGFYLIDKKIVAYNFDNNIHPNPSNEEITKSLDLIESLQQKFKNKKAFPTVLRWSIMAPFNYIMKQVNRDLWMPWLDLYGFPRTGKTTLGHISCAIWGNYLNDDYVLPFTNVDTNAKLGEALSKSTYPLLINETGSLSEESRIANKGLIEMIKTSIEGKKARSKFVHKTIYTEIPSFCACILTSNSAPPSDIGFRRRIIAMPFTQNDQYSLEEINDFDKLIEVRIKNELRIIGDFTANYFLNNQHLLLLTNNDKDDKKNVKNWKYLSLIVLKEMYRTIQKDIPKWIESIIENEIQLEESKEEIDLILRNFLINKVNESYSKHHRSIDPSIDGTNQHFEYRLDFCLEHNLLPFLNLNKNKGILITSDLIRELKGNRINTISSLQEVATIITGFEYSQKKLGGNRNIRAAHGSRIKLIEFLAVSIIEEEEENKNNSIIYEKT